MAMTGTMRFRAVLALAALTPAAWALAGCGAAVEPEGDPGVRGYRMGFSSLGPRLTIEDILTTVDLWTPRGDAAVLHVDVPWAALLDGGDAAAIVQAEHLPLVELYRDRGLMVVITVDATNGLAREQEAEALVALGRSITEPEVQAVHRDWVVAVAEVLEPDHLGLAAETNLVRLAAPAAVYDALAAMAGASAAAVRALPTPPELYVSVQVEVAWGRLGGPAGYQGIADDLVDFPFIDAVGLSSYPYLGGFAAPDDLPTDYYRRVADEADLPVLVVEGGWPSESAAGFGASPAEQAAYVRRHAELLQDAGAIAVLHLTFTDLDLAAWPQPIPEILILFASLGLVTDDYAAKPALAVWDSLYSLSIERP